MLEATSGIGGGRNQAVQKGSVSIAASASRTIVNLRMNVSGVGAWTARLKVQPIGAAAYEQFRSGTGDMPSSRTGGSETCQGQNDARRN